MYALFDRKGTAQRKSKSMAKSSVNFAKAKGHSEDHNSRKDEPSYLLPKEHRLENEIWKHSKSEKEIFTESAALQKTGRKPKFENSRWEAIINFNKNHSLGDLKKVAEHIEKKFNITCTSIAMHKDEGHLNERGVPIYNLHAHVNFITHKDGKQNWRKEFIQPKHLRELQTEVAELLGMERGIDKRISGTERVEHVPFRAQKKKEEKQLSKQKDLKAEIAELRTQLQAQGAKREDYAKLEAFSKELKEQVKAKDLTIDELKRSVNTWRNKSTNWEEAKTYKELYEEIKEEKIELEAKISNFKPLDVEIPQKSDKSDLKAISEELERTNQVVPSDYDLEEAQRRGSGFVIHRFIEDKGTKGERTEKVDWLHKLDIPTVTFDVKDLEKLKEDLNQVDKVQIGLARKALNAYNQVQKNLHKIKNFIKEKITPKKKFERSKNKSLDLERENKGMSR